MVAWTMTQIMLGVGVRPQTGASGGDPQSWPMRMIRMHTQSPPGHQSLCESQAQSERADWAALSGRQWPKLSGCAGQRK